MSTEKYSVLMVEDDQLLGSGLEAGLRQLGMRVRWAKDGQEALACVQDETFDAIILDLGLPKLSGLKVLRQWRQEGNITPILILTARDSTSDKVAGLDTGGDDYLVKPFDLDELGARIRALIRRKSKTEKIEAQETGYLHYREYIVDPNAFTVTKDGIAHSLPRREFSLLLKLVENAGQVVTREQLLNSIYGDQTEIDSNTLEVHMHNLRKKLAMNCIRTIRGVGYLAEK